jgi:hypothetical protein
VWRHAVTAARESHGVVQPRAEAGVPIHEATTVSLGVIAKRSRLALNVNLQLLS